MQITLKDRETITGVVTVYTPPVDISSMSRFTYNATAHASSGTTPTFDLVWETSDNLEDWEQIGSTANLTAVGTVVGGLSAEGESYGRYVRAKLMTGGTNPMWNYSLWINTFASS